METPLDRIERTLDTYGEQAALLRDTMDASERAEGCAKLQASLKDVVSELNSLDPVEVVSERDWAGEFRAILQPTGRYQEQIETERKRLMSVMKEYRDKRTALEARLKEHEGRAKEARAAVSGLQAIIADLDKAEKPEVAIKRLEDELTEARETLDAGRDAQEEYAEGVGNWNVATDGLLKKVLNKRDDAARRVAE
jgi:hypothetical protein